MGTATVMAHDAVEPVPLFIRILKDGSPAVPTHAQVVHPHEHSLSPWMIRSQISTSKQQRGFFTSMAIFFPSGAEWM
jgi:hypothetical protein